MSQQWAGRGRGARDPAARNGNSRKRGCSPAVGDGERVLAARTPAMSNRMDASQVPGETGALPVAETPLSGSCSSKLAARPHRGGQTIHDVCGLGTLGSGSGSHLSCLAEVKDARDQFAGCGECALKGKAFTGDC